MRTFTFRSTFLYGLESEIALIHVGPQKSKVSRKTQTQHNFSPESECCPPPHPLVPRVGHTRLRGRGWGTQFRRRDRQSGTLSYTTIHLRLRATFRSTKALIHRPTFIMKKLRDTTLHRLKISSKADKLQKPKRRTLSQHSFTKEEPIWRRRGCLLTKRLEEYFVPSTKKTLNKITFELTGKCCDVVHYFLI
jgi:hypothetical protein